MKNLIITEPAKAMLKKLPPAVQKKAKKQLLLLVQNLNHPSIRAKKYDEANDIWQGRIDKAYRFYFTIEGDTYFVHSFKEHPK